MPVSILKFVSFFDRQQLYYALRLTLASVLALAGATALGLQNAYWAAMTVWIVAQPTRGLMIERNFYRLIGTGAGTAIAFLVLKLTKNPFLVISALSFVIVVCVGIGNLVSSSKSYGVLLVGYTMAIVILPDIGDLAHPHDLPWARVVATVIGVLVSMLVGAMFAPRSPRRAFASRTRSAGFDTFIWVADIVGKGTADNGDQYLVEIERRLIREIADIEGMIESVAAGSPDAHKRMRYLRVFLLQLVNVMAITRTLAARRLVTAGEGRDIAGCFRELAEAIRTEGDTAAAELRLRKVCDAAGEIVRQDVSILKSLIDAVRQAMAAIGDFTRDASSLERVEYELHRDVPGAIRAAVRAYVSFTVIAAIWLVTGWSGGPYTLMGMAIFLMVFSTFPYPHRALMGVFYGTITGTLAAFAGRWLMLEYATTYAGILLILLPFVIVGALARVYPPTEKPAIDYGMSLFVTSQPMMPLHGGMEISFSIGWSMTVAIVIVILSFRFVVPARAGFPARDLEKALAEDLRKIAGRRGSRETGQRLTRMLHRVLRLAALADARRANRLETAIAPISAAHAIRQLQADIASGSLSGPVVAESEKVLHAIADKDGTLATVQESIGEAIASLHRLRAGPELVATIGDIREALCRAELYASRKAS